MSLFPLWEAFLKQQSKQRYFSELMAAITRQRVSGIEIFPPQAEIYRALTFVDLDQVKVVILGQDPYHGPNQAQGMAFSVSSDMKIPPSLKNIFKELTQDIEGFITPQHGDLSQWAEQGVLLLNTVLTVQQAKAHSHAKLGWEQFTAALIATISELNPHCVFLLWGAHAQEKGKNVDTKKHLILHSVHPSPLSAYRGFLGCQHFSRANQWLGEQGCKSIEWKITDRGSLPLF